jgi:hypothetical protein
VRRIASSSEVESYAIRQVAGPFVLLDSSYGSQYGTDRSTVVSDLRTGRSYVVAALCFRTGEGPCSDQQAEVSAAFVNAHGQSAAAIVPYGTGTTIIAGFSSHGERQDLDAGPSSEIPATSLALTGSTVTWTHSGTTRGATLAG